MEIHRGIKRRLASGGVIRVDPRVDTRNTVGRSIVRDEDVERSVDRGDKETRTVKVKYKGPRKPVWWKDYWNMAAIAVDGKVSSRKRKRCENNKAARRARAFQAMAKGRSLRPARRKHRC